MEPRRLSPGLFFALDLEGGHMSAAHMDTRISYSTICDAKRGRPLRATTAKKLEEWSRGLPSAQKANVCIGAAVAAGVAESDELPRKLAREMAARAA